MSTIALMLSDPRVHQHCRVQQYCLIYEKQQKQQQIKQKFGMMFALFSAHWDEAFII